MELTPFQRIKAQIKFWRQHVPFGCFQYVDTGLFDDEHFHLIPFSIHWKHGTPFDLLFEYLPYNPKTPEEEYEENIQRGRAYARLKLKEKQDGK